MAQLDQGDQRTGVPAPSQQTNSLAQLAALLVPAALAALLPVGRAGSLLKRKLFEFAPDLAERLEGVSTPVFLRRQSPMFDPRSLVGTVESLPLSRVGPEAQEVLELSRLSRPDIPTKGRGLFLGTNKLTLRQLEQNDPEGLNTLLHEGIHADLATQQYPRGIPSRVLPQRIVEAGMPPIPTRADIQRATGEFEDMPFVYTSYRPQHPQWQALAEMMTEYQSRRKLREAFKDPMLFLSSWKTHSQDPDRILPYLLELEGMSKGKALPRRGGMSPPPISGGSDAFSWKDPWGDVLNEKEFEWYITQVLKSVEWPDAPEYRNMVRQRLLKHPRALKPPAAPGKGHESRKEAQYGWE